MSDVAIQVEGLSKRYRLGAKQQGYRTMRETLVEAAGAPARRLRSAMARKAGSQSNGDNFIWALDDVSFEVKQGEVVGIIGRNGAGKSTLLKVLSRITKPTKGYARIHGRVGSLLEVGTGFHPELTGRENVYLNGAILGMKRGEIERKFDEMVAFAEVERFIDTPVKHYSSGMYLRLAFAVAAHLEPEVLVVDEVLAVGDAAFQKKCLGKMGEVAKEGRTVLFVSHNLTAIRTLCSRAILLRQGDLIEDGSPAHVVATYFGTERKSRSEISWDDIRRSPGNEALRLQSVRVREEMGNVTNTISSQHSINIEIKYANLCTGTKLGATVVLYNEEGICIFSSLSNQKEQWHGQPAPEGLVHSTCRIPGNLLASGRYSVTVLLWTENYQLAHREDQAVEFEVEDNRELRGDYYGGWSGVIRPALQWNTEILLNEETS